MSQIWRFVRVLALGTWVGAIIYFVAVVTQGAFAVLSNRDEAGLLVGFTLGGLHLMGLIAAVIFVLPEPVKISAPAEASRAREQVQAVMTPHLFEPPSPPPRSIVPNA